MRQSGEFNHRKVGVIGIGRAGHSAALALDRAGAKVTLYDPKPLRELGEEARRLADGGFSLVAGSADYPGIEGEELLVPSPGVRSSAPVLESARARGVPIYGEIEIGYRLADAPILAVTGTNGKSTTTAMLGAMLDGAYPRVWIGGNLAPGDPLPGLAIQADREEIIVAEVSSFQLEQIVSFRPRVALLTNLSPDHLDRHRDMTEYGAAKARIFENQNPDDFALVNADVLALPELGLRDRIHARLGLFAVDRESIEIAGSLAARGGLPEPERAAWVEDGHLVLSRSGYKEAIAPLGAMPVPGRHNVENALAAALCARLMGASPETIRRGLENFQPVAHRMVSVAMVEGVRYVNNSMCTNPAALVASLRSYDTPVVLISGGRNKNLDFTRAGPEIARGAKAVVLIGQDADEIERAIGREGASMARALSMEDAVSQARAFAEPGDVVMLAPGCASMDMFHDFMDRGEQFVQAVRRLQEEGSGRGAVH